MAKIAVIDLGTVTERLAISRVEAGVCELMEKRSTIVNVGAGVDETHRLAEDAIARAAGAAATYVERIREVGADAVCCTMTSAARDAENACELTGAFEALGLAPQVIPGEIEGSLTFLGVAQNFFGERIMVADNGGGSTELAVGRLDEAGLAMEWVRSIDVGCRRMTDRFLLDDDPPSAQALARAHAFAADEFTRAIETSPVASRLPQTLVVTGGTSTTLVALSKELVPYDSSRVHLAQLGRGEVERLEGVLAGVTLKQRAQLAGIQPQRASVILGGVAAVLELMRAVGVDVMTVSESDLLVGLSLVCGALVNGDANPLAWTPQLGEPLGAA